MSQALNILQKYWRYDSFKNNQEQIINAVLGKNDTLVLLPTGGGKSLCYQIPALLCDGTCIVISPLLSLMKDQVDHLQAKGIKANMIQSKATTDEIVALFDNVKYGGIKFLYLSPERLQSDLIIQKISELTIDILAIDEAHCISEWGHDFRPSYRRISDIKNFAPKATMIALTATATHKVVDDIVQSLALKSPQIFKQSFSRKNLAYQIFSIENKLDRLIQIFTKNPTPTIVYVNSRKKAEEISTRVNLKGFASVFYHGGMPSKDKSEAFDLWMKEEFPIMVATNAFGMGIDKSNVKVVVHLDLPNSIENYVQEAGRAGRNGMKSFSVVLQNEDDIAYYKKNTIDRTPSIKEIKEIHKKLYLFFRVAKGEKIEEGFQFNFQEFCHQYALTPKKVSAVLLILKKHEIIRLNEQFNKKSTVQFTINPKHLSNYKKRTQFTTLLTDLLLRSYGGIFQKETPINEFQLAKKLNRTSLTVKEELKKLHDDNVIIYKEINSHQELFFLMPREDDQTINRIGKSIQNYLQQQVKKAEKLIQFIRNNEVCRNIQILHYFDEPSTEPCGICDVCLSKKRNDTPTIIEGLLTLLKKHQKISQQEIITILKANPEDVLIHLRQLLSEDIIGITNDTKFFLK
ncbi:MAG: RecQ family ATP-dependent DNA helicase [Flavobacteriaceae bacterium]